MRPLFRLGWLPLLLVGSACCTPSLPKPALADFDCVMPKTCETAIGDVVVSIDAQGNATPDCVEIDQEKNRVTWTGAKDAGIEYLSVQFKDVAGRRRPDNPLCSGPLCFLSASMVKADKGLYCYAIVLRTKDGRTRVVDPKLIIKY